MRTPAGVFPPRAGDDASPFAESLPAIMPQAWQGAFRASPRVRRNATCVSVRQPVGVARNGVPILPAIDAAGRDAVAREVEDVCRGSTTPSGAYHYRSVMPCLPKDPSRRRHSRLVGWARDGFRIYGPRGAGGEQLHNDDLDACHGHVHTITVRGRRVRQYHYHLTSEFPYSVGCFRGRPSANWRLAPLSASAATAAPPAVAPSAPTQLSVVADTALVPGFDPAVSDYVTRCTAGVPVRLSLAAPPGTTAAVDGAPARSGFFASSVALTPGQGFAFTVASASGSSEFHVRCLPADFPAYTAQRNGTPQAGWFLLTPGSALSSYVAIFDSRGVPVWWQRTPNFAVNLTLLPGGALAWFNHAVGGFGVDPASSYEIHRLDGSLVQNVATVGSPTDQHDIQVMPNGNFLLLTYRPRDGVDLAPFGGPANATVLDAEIQEVTAAGALVFSWNSSTHIGLAETGRWYAGAGGVIATPQPLLDGRTAYDIVHINSVQPDGDGFVFSARHLDAVYRIDRATGNIDWKLGGTARAESLTVVGDPNAGATTFGGQHDARILADGTLTLHDNGTGLGRAPRSVRYAIDTIAGSATRVEQVVSPSGTPSFCCGSARRLAGGDWVATWGSTPVTEELDPAGRVVFRLTLAPPGLFSYRSIPEPPSALNRVALRAGMDAMHPR